MALHRALSDYDVLFSIFEHFGTSRESWYNDEPRETAYATVGHAWNSEERARRGTLACCARVCRSFFQPAVALLWRNIDDVTEVLALLHAAPPLAPDDEGQESQLRPMARPRQPAWLFAELSARAILYAARVRTIRGRHRKLPGDDDHHTLLPHIHRVDLGYLFPHLSHLRFTQWISHSASLLEVIPPDLCSLHVDFRLTPSHLDVSPTPRCPSQREPFIREFMRQLTRKAPHLRYLRITTLGEASESWFDAIDELSELETFDLLEPIYSPVTTFPLLPPLSALQNLQHLKLRLPATGMTCIEVDVFPSLRTVSLDASFAPFASARAFLSGISSPKLESLTLLNCECSTATAHVDLHELTEITRRKFSRTLRHFVFSMRGISPLRPYPHQLSKAIEPLFEVRGLTDVRLTIEPEETVLAASEDDFKRMCEAWPNLTHLHLRYHPSSALPFLRDLVDAARRLPALAELVLPGLDASAVDLDDLLARPSEGPAFHSLRTLDLAYKGWYSRIPDLKRLAVCLNELFPAADWRRPRFAVAGVWGGTVEELLQFQYARALSVM